jgi:chromatin remodeling complex protein RSC6
MPLEDNITSQISTLLTTISTLVGELKTVQTQVKTLQKNYVKVLKDHNKTLNKKKSVNRKPSGFAKPSKISEEMATFLSLDPKEEVPRNQITKLINQYIIDNELRNETDKRQILPDKPLSTLLNLKGDEQLSYFNLQKYMKHHFIKTPVAAV